MKLIYTLTLALSLLLLGIICFQVADTKLGESKKSTGTIISTQHTVSSYYFASEVASDPFRFDPSVYVLQVRDSAGNYFNVGCDKKLFYVKEVGDKVEFETLYSKFTQQPLESYATR